MHRRTPGRTVTRLATFIVLVLVGCSSTQDAGPVINTDGGPDSTDVRRRDATADVRTEPDMRDESDATPDAATDAPPDEPDLPDNRVALGTVWNTYYWLADEAEHPGAKTVELLDPACEPVATVSEDYADALCIEGSGKLEDGTIVNYAELCDCGRPCSSGAIICWSALDGAAFPWGQGAFGNALEPLRSLAVDPDFVPLRTPIYIEEFDGIEIPDIGGVGPFTHDGCFRADDTGGAIDDNHIDVFAGTTPMWRHLEGVYPTRSELTAFTGVGKCAYLEL